jgi:MFS family permease
MARKAPRTGSRGAVDDATPLKQRDSSADAPFYAWYVLGVLFLVYVLNFIDRSIVSILAQAIKADLRLADQELGFLYGTAFAVFYALFGIPLGRLADGWYRGRLIAIGLIAWSSMTALSGFATSFEELAIARIGVGIGEASASPAAYSLLADHFPARKRALVLAIYTAGLYVGGGLSLPIGGSVAHAWTMRFAAGTAPLGLAGWQAAFLAVGLPGLVLALWVLTLREPPRGLAEGRPSPVVRPGAWRAFARELVAVMPPCTLWSVSRFPGALPRNLAALGTIGAVAFALARLSGDGLQWGTLGIGVYAAFSWTQMLHATDRPTYTLLFGTRAITLALCGFGAIAYISYSLAFWAPPYAMRTFGVRADVAGRMLGIPGAFASAVGCVTGGYLADVWKRHDARARLFVCMLAASLPVPLLFAALAVSQVESFYVLYALTVFVAYLWVGPAAAAVQDCMLPRMRGVAGAIFLLAVSILGLGLGPYATGKVAALTGTLRGGMASMAFVAPLACCLLWLASRHIGAAETTRAARAAAAGEEASFSASALRQD